jgi:hypothetical protein
MAEALLGMFETTSLADAQSSLDASARYFTAHVSLVQLKDVLIKQQVHEDLAQKLTLALVDAQDDRFHSTNLIVSEISTGVYQAAVCIFKNFADNIKDFICFTADVKLSADRIDQASFVKQAVLTALKNLVAHLPSRIIKYHAFTHLSLNQFNSLKSAQTQSDLNKMLKEALGEKR